MSNLNGIPSADYFETRLANLRSGINGVVHVEAVPAGSLPAGEYSYIVVNPGESNMQVAKVDGWDSDALTFNVIDAGNTSAGIGDLYEVKPHPAGSKVRFSNNYAFWKDIQEAVNSKADDSSISAVGKSNDYGDLDNKPAISTVGLSNDYNDLDNLPAPVSIDGADKILNLSGSNVLSATVSASYNSGTKKITLYGKNSEVLSEIDCTAFIKDGMVQDVKIVTDPAGYAPGKYLEFDFNTDSGTEDIYIALSDLAVYTAGEGINISSNAISVVAATASTLGGIKVGSGLTITSGTLSADSQTDENYTTAEKTKLSGIEAGSQVNKIDKVQVNGTDLSISSKTVNVKIKTLNGEQIAGEGDLDIMARHYTEGTGISIDEHDEISISSAYQTAIANKANSSDLAAVATSGAYSDIIGTPTQLSDFNNDVGYTTNNGTITSVKMNGNVVSSSGEADLGTVITSHQDISGKQDKSNMVTTLVGADNDHYPTAKAVSDAISGAGAGDMMASVYDPNSVEGDAFDMDNMVQGTTNKFVSVGDINNWNGKASVIGFPNGTTKAQINTILSGLEDLQQVLFSTANGTVTRAWLGNTAPNAAIKGIITKYTATNSVHILAHTYNGDVFTVAYKYSDGTLLASVEYKQTQLTAGSNITINGTTISATDTTYVASDFDIKDLTDSTNLRSTWNGKQDALVDGTNIKTINSQSITGSGNFDVINLIEETDYSGITPQNGTLYIGWEE